MCMRFLVQRQLLLLTVQNHGKENPEFCCEKNLLSGILTGIGFVLSSRIKGTFSNPHQKKQKFQI